MSTILNAIVQHSKRYPTKNAIVCDDASINYDQFLKKITVTKAELTAKGIQSKQSIVFFSGHNSVDFFILLVALMDLEVNLFLIDAKTSETEWDELQKTFLADFICRENKSYPGLTCSSYNLQELDGKINEFAGEPKLYFFSSGSTGSPKAFGYTYPNLYYNLSSFSAYLGFSKDDKVLCPVSATHNHGFIMTVSFLLLGATVFVVSPQCNRSEIIADTITENNISILTGVPFQYNYLLEQVTNEQAFQSLRYALCGSAPMNEHLAIYFEQKFNVRLNQAYGISEIGPICVNTFDEGVNNFISVGKVLPEIDYKIIREDGSLSAVNEEGELVVKASFMSDGYLNNEEENNKLLQNGWMHTQDIVRQDEDKNIYIVGRKTTFINNAGYKVYPIEVEKVILSLKGIKEVAVIGAEDVKRAQKIRAYITLFFPVSEVEIRSHCKQYLASYKVPHELIICDDLPMNSIEKVITSKLK